MRPVLPGVLLVSALGVAACGGGGASSSIAAGRHSSHVPVRHRPHHAVPTGASAVGSDASVTPSTTAPAAATTSTSVIVIPPAGSGPTTRPAAPRPAGGQPPTTTTSTTSPVTTLLVQFGSGVAESAKFTVTGATWQVHWSYDCSSFGSVGNFVTSVNGYGSALYTQDQGTNQVGPRGSGDDQYADQGTFNLSIDSECNWSISVIQG